MHTSFLLLGSNVGDRLGWLAFAIQKLGDAVGEIQRASQLYQTEPWGNPDQQAFINQALEVTTHLSPKALLSRIRDIEDEAGRDRTVQWGPRTLDIDILLYENLVVDTRDLTIPHPRMALRRFVLKPLSEIAGNVIHPVLDISISELLEVCPDHSEVAILAEG